MKIQIQTMYTRASEYLAAQYQRGLAVVGLTDCTEMRVTAAVAVSVVLYYVLVLIGWVSDLCTAGATITAIVVQ